MFDICSLGLLQGSQSHVFAVQKDFTFLQIFPVDCHIVSFSRFVCCLFAECFVNVL